MKVAILSESPADDAALRILVGSLLRVEIDEVVPLRLRGSGWGMIHRMLPNVICKVHYHTNASHLVVLADSDDSPAHREEHEADETLHENCRLCLLRRLATETIASLDDVPGEVGIKVAVAVPAIEGWYQCGKASANSEQAFALELQEKGRIRFVRQRLKRDVYGTERPSRDLEGTRAIEEAQRLAKDLTQLERLFPGGFGTFATEVRSWREP